MSGARSARDRALAVLRSATAPEAVAAASEMLAPDDPDFRDEAIRRYERLAKDPYRLDQGAHIRAQLLRSLTPAALPDDLPMLEIAAATYEFLPPGRQEVCGRLRSAALVAMSRLDERLAAFHSARLLTDRHTSDMSGEPALTAVRVLAAQSEIIVLYGFLAAPGLRRQEPAAEAFRALGGAPARVLRPLLDRYLGADDEVVLLGLFDLLLARDDRDVFGEPIAEFLRSTRLLDLYRYLVTAIVAGRHETLLGFLVSLRSEATGMKLEILDEALRLLEPPISQPRR